MTNHQQSIEAERAKSVFSHTEQVRPGHTMTTELKSIIVSTHSEFQKIDVIETSFGKVLITDGKTQSAEVDEFIYHESLVHPSLIQSILLRENVMSKQEQDRNHRQQQLSVFIGGGGELATAREVLRHKAVKRVVMVDLDKTLIDVCRKFLPEWGGDDVANNPRLELIVGDAYAYLAKCKDKFDVIIMDISDPIEAGPGIMLYTKEFYDHAKTLLNSPNGVFVTQAGYGGQWDAAEEDVCFAAITNTLQSTFDCVVPYTTYIQSFGSEWGFVMAFGCCGSEPSTDAAVTKFTKMEMNQINDIVSQNITEIEDVGNDDKLNDAKDGLTLLKFYDGESHHTMFALPKYTRLAIARDTRIMTKENPIFMF